MAEWSQSAATPDSHDTRVSVGMASSVEIERPMDTTGQNGQIEHPGLAIVGAAAATSKYLSCRHLERGMVFSPGRVITPCCMNPATGLVPELVPFNGKDFSIDAMLEARAQMISRHKAGDIVNECRACPRLTERQWDAAEIGSYAIDDVTVAPFSSCNIRCNYCYTVTNPEQTSPLSKAPRVLPVFEELIERKLLAPHATVRFSGGEPTLSPEFEPLLTLLNNYGVRSVVYTNATKRSDAIMDALQRDQVELVLGIDAASTQVYKAIKKMNYHDKVWKVVAEYCAAMRPDAVNKVWAKFIFCLENYHEAANFVARADSAGAKYIYYDFDSTRVRPGDLRNSVGLPEEVTGYVALLRHECMKRGIIVEFAEAGLAWLTPERTRRIEGELERLDHVEGAASLAAAMPGTGQLDVRRLALIAAQAGLL
jgi:organic radical activating enzyme